MGKYFLDKYLNFKNKETRNNKKNKFAWHMYRTYSSIFFTW